jgi:SAM-dependent methyltransferase
VDEFITENMTDLDVVTYDLTLLDQSQAKWKRSGVLRLLYRDLFGASLSEMILGETLEVGSGIGVIHEFYPDVVTSDVAKTPYVDQSVSCYEIAQTSGKSWDNILALDVFHHLQRPLDFLASAGEALRPGGRIILNEPAATSWGSLFYRRFHHEPCDRRRVLPPYEFPADDAAGHFSNMGMAVALFEDRWVETERFLEAKGLQLKKKYYRDLLAYPATGGFSRPQLLPTFAFQPILKLERMLPQSLMRLIGLRIVIVLEKTG